MEDFGAFLTQYATSEVFTVLAALATAWIGWKAARKTGGMIKSLAGKASFAGLASVALLFAGFSGIGLGIGEWRSRDSGPSKPEAVGLNDCKLTEMVKKGGYSNDDAIRYVLDYAQQRDEKNRRSQLAYNIQTLPPNELEKELHNWLAVDGVEPIPVSFQQNVPFQIRPAEDQPINEESIMSTPVAWLSLCLGIASLIASVVVWDTRRT